ncbi:hypothetical protein C8Q76DRAFT_689619 [Earliella scabrosa]|nr:hypothetical protein C8Q76DRAFT_689619 [Earliella scabrosa]
MPSVHVPPATARRVERDRRIRAGLEAIDTDAQARMLEGSSSDDGSELLEETVSGRRADRGGDVHSVESVDQEPGRPEEPAVHTSQGPPNDPDPIPDPSILAADLYSLERILLTNVLSFTLLDRSLRFVNDPTTSGGFVRELAGPEEARLHAVERLREKFMEEIERLEDIKEAEWDYQQLKPAVDEDDAPYEVDTATMNLLCGLPLRSTRLLIGGLRDTYRLTLEYARGSNILTSEDERLLRFLSRDPRTILTTFHLDPSVHEYTLPLRLGYVPSNLPRAATLAAQSYGAKSLPEGRNGSNLFANTFINL